MQRVTDETLEEMTDEQWLSVFDHEDDIYTDGGLAGYKQAPLSGSLSAPLDVTMEKSS